MQPSVSFAAVSHGALVCGEARGSEEDALAELMLDDATVLTALALPQIKILPA